MGRITLRDHALVAANVARAKGGGILAYDPVRLYDHACVERNLAQRGGGILFVGASLALRQHALITDNRAGVVGGGVLARVLRHATIRVGADAAIRGNSPQNVTVHKVDFVRPPEA